MALLSVTSAPPVVPSSPLEALAAMPSHLASMGLSSVVDLSIVHPSYPGRPALLGETALQLHGGAGIRGRVTPAKLAAVKASVTLYVQPHLSLPSASLQLWDTFLHELAHAAHMRQLWLAAITRATKAQDLDLRRGREPHPLNKDLYWDASIIFSQLHRGRNSNHGYFWRRWAKSFGAVPTARGLAFLPQTSFNAPQTPVGAF